MLVFECGRQEVDGPVDAVFARGPSLEGVAVEAVDEDDVCFCEGVGVDSCELVTGGGQGDFAFELVLNGG